MDKPFLGNLSNTPLSGRRMGIKAQTLEILGESFFLALARCQMGTAFSYQLLRPEHLRVCSVKD